MRIFVYEFATGGGLIEAASADRLDGLDHLVVEGSAMVRALVADLSGLPGVAVDVLQDCRLAGDWGCATMHPVASASDEREAIARLARAADWTIVIAPEIDGQLVARCRAVEAAGGRLLGPSSQLVALAADKQAAAEHLARRGVGVPHGISIAAGEELPAVFPYPAVLKPRDGAGSLGIRLVERWPPGEPMERPGRLEPYHPGTAASVACLCGPGRIVPLVGCWQRLSNDGRFSYRGGSLPLGGSLGERATSLAARAVAALGDPLGYVGVDLVLGANPSGSDDVVVELNPRLTTSYVGYRAAAVQNLAGTMLTIAAGGPSDLAWRPGSFDFDAAGTVRWNREAT